MRLGCWKGRREGCRGDSRGDAAWWMEWRGDPHGYLIVQKPLAGVLFVPPSHPIGSHAAAAIHGASMQKLLTEHYAARKASSAPDASATLWRRWGELVNNMVPHMSYWDF